MAKNQVKAGGTSRIRFVMLEAELADGDLSQITQAIQNALRGSSSNVQRITAPVASKALPPASGEDGEETTTIDDVDALDEPSVVPPQKRRPRRPSAIPSVVDIDVKSAISLASFVGSANPKSNHDRFILIAAWLHEHRSTPVIDADHVYTCYRSLEWPVGIPDFSQPLRELKHKRLFSSPERGKYTINRLGIARAEKIRSGTE